MDRLELRIVVWLFSIRFLGIITNCEEKRRATDLEKNVELVVLDGGAWQGRHRLRHLGVVSRPEAGGKVGHALGPVDEAGVVIDPGSSIIFYS